MLLVSWWFYVVGTFSPLRCLIFGNSQRERNTMSKPHINVTPLIDVLLVLLIIFMVVSPLKPSSFQAKIPREPKNIKDVIPDPRTLVVTIYPDASLKLNGESALGTVEESSRLTERLKTVFRERTDNRVLDENNNVLKTVFIKAPRGIGYGSVAKVIDAVKISGAQPISLQIDDLD